MVLVVNITKEQLRAIKNNNILGSGNFSKVYDVSGNEIIKLWKQNAIDMSDNTLFLENMMNVYNKGKYLLRMAFKRYICWLYERKKYR